MGSAELYDLEQVAFPSLGLSFPIWAELAFCHLPSVDSLSLSNTRAASLNWDCRKCPPYWLASVIVGGGGTRGSNGRNQEQALQVKARGRNKASFLLPRITFSLLLEYVNY